MKKIYVLIFSLLCCLVIVSCDKKQETRIEIIDPFIEVNTLKEAEEISGFQLNLPDNFFDESYERKVRAIENKFIEVDYRSLEEWIIIRKSLYDGEGDISGDYNEYPEHRTEIYGDIKVLLRGNEGKINVISWIDGDYVYSVNINPGGIGIDEDIFYEILVNLIN